MNFSMTVMVLILGDTLLNTDGLVIVSESPSNMQSLLNSLFEYGKKWHLLINSAKSKVMIFPPNGRKKSVEKYLFFFNNDVWKMLQAINTLVILLVIPVGPTV